MTKFQAKCFDSATLLELTASTLIERQLAMEMPAFKSLVQWYSTLWAAPLNLAMYDLVYNTRFSHLRCVHIALLKTQLFEWTLTLHRKLGQKMRVPCKYFLSLWCPLRLFIGSTQYFCKAQLQLARPAWSSTSREPLGTNVWESITMSTQTYKSMLACTLPAARDSWFSKKVWCAITWCVN